MDNQNQFKEDNENILNNLSEKIEKIQNDILI